MHSTRGLHRAGFQLLVEQGNEMSLYISYQDTICSPDFSALPSGVLELRKQSQNQQKFPGSNDKDSKSFIVMVF